MGESIKRDRRAQDVPIRGSTNQIAHQKPQIKTLNGLAQLTEPHVVETAVKS